MPMPIIDYVGSAERAFTSSADVVVLKGIGYALLAVAEELRLTREKQESTVKLTGRN